jgi:hypothetical protein
MEAEPAAETLFSQHDASTQSNARQFIFFPKRTQTHRDVFISVFFFF